MRKSNFGSGISQRQSVLKPRNNDITPNSRLSAGQHNKRKVRGSSEGMTRLSQVTGRFTPTRSNIPRYTPVRSNAPSSSALSQPPSASRQSMDSVRNSSMGGKNRKETRPIGEMSFKSECIDKVLEFLATNGYDQQVNRRTLLNPSTKDFTNIFTFIYRHFDRSYVLPHKFEEEIPRLLKLCKYPIQMSKSSFISVGSRHTWPAVLAVLAWLIDSITIYNSTDSFAAAFPMDFDMESTIKLKRIVKLFELFDCGDNSDMIEEHYTDYGHAIDIAFEVRCQDMIAMQEKSEKIDEEIAKQSSGPERLQQLNQQYEQLVNDKEKMICYNRELQVHLTAKDTERAQLESKLAECKAELLHISEELNRLETFKAHQALSAGELARFKNHSKDVAMLIGQLQTQGKDLDSQIWTLEMTLGKAQKELLDKVSCFNTTVREMDLSESFWLESGNTNVQYIKNNLLGDLYDCKKNKKHITFETQNQKIRKEEELAMVQENLKDKKDRTNKLESKLRRMEEDISMTKNEILTEEREMQQENERLHQQIVEARKSHKTSLHQKQFLLDQAKEELQATKVYGKDRMCSGAEFIVKVCHRSLEDLDTKTNEVVLFKLNVKKYCHEVLETIRCSDL